MRRISRASLFTGLGFCSLGLLLTGPAATLCLAQPPTAAQGKPAEGTSPLGSVPFTSPASNSGLRPFPINLPTALKLGNARSIDIEAATARLRIAGSQLNQAEVLWLPSMTLGAAYYRHDGQIQNSTGAVADANYQALMLGAGSGLGTSAAISLNDAFFAPLAARQVVQARRAELNAAANDNILAVTEAYFNVQQARGELAGAIDATHRAEDLVRRTEKLAPGLVPPVEAIRAQAEMVRRQQAEITARERWRLASADLVRVLRLDPTAQIEPIEPPFLQVTLVPPEKTIDELIAVALTSRPELAANQALVQATLQRIRQEHLRPLIPSLVIRGVSTPASGTLAAGYYAAGTGSLSNTGGRMDVDIQLLWQLDNLGFGNYAKTQERRAENRQAMIELYRVQDQVAAEVSQALAQAQSAASRVSLAERGLRLSLDSADKNLAGLSQTQRAGELVILVIRPQEAVAAVQALSQAYADYYAAVNDSNRAQFRLFRALGKPAEMLLEPAAPNGCCTPTADPALTPPSSLPLPQHLP